MGCAASIPASSNVGSQPIVRKKEITRQAVGRAAWLGDLYDARTDTFCSTSIFKEKLPTDSPAIRTQDIHHTSTVYTESDSFEEKMSKLDVDLQLTLNILAGLVIPGGSA